MISLKNKFNKTNIIFFTVGMLILAICIKTTGIEPVVRNMLVVGNKFWIIVSIHLISNIFLTLGWWVLFPQKIEIKHFPKFLAARIAGDTTSFINSMGAVAGEPLKALYVKDIVPLKTGLATVFLDRTIHTIASILIVLTGIICSMFVLNIPFYITLICLFLMIVLLIIMMVLVKKQREGILEFFVSKLPGFLNRKFITEERMNKIRILDDEIKLIINDESKRRPIIACLLLHYFSVLIIATLEIYLIIAFTNSGIDFTVLDAMFLYIFSFLFTAVMFFIPANIGTSEGSYSLGLVLLGFNPALGVSIGFIRRLRTLVWAIIGLLLMFSAGLRRNNK